MDIERALPIYQLELCTIIDGASLLPIKLSTVDLVNMLHGVLAIIGVLDDELYYVI